MTRNITCEFSLVITSTTIFQLASPPNNSENETALNSVKQNTQDAQKESTSVKQSKCNSKTDETDLSSKIEKSQTFLRRNPNPEYKPVKHFKSRPTEAEPKADAERANMFKDSRTYNDRSSSTDKPFNKRSFAKVTLPSALFSFPPTTQNATETC